MGRAPRRDPEHGWHHVMNRGVAKQRVFHSRADGEMFEALLGEGHDRFGVEVHAYCLMTNHYHLLLRCPEGGLSDFMQLVSARFTRAANHRLERDGPMFRGRFKSLLVDSDAYLGTVGRYIHSNPLDIRPSVEIDRYRWSSFRHYCGAPGAPPWLHLAEMLAPHGSPAAHRSYVEDGRPSDVAPTWAIAAAVEEHDDLALHRAQIERTVATIILDHGPASLVAALESWLAFPNDVARSSALRRARLQIGRAHV